MRRIRYSVAMSLDGYIAGPKGEFDWITTDPDFDFSAVFNQFDTIVAGAVRLSRWRQRAALRYLASRQSSCRQPCGRKTTLTDLKASPGRDIWLFGAGKLFRSLAEAGMVDTVEVSVIPILLGDGVPLAPNLSKWINLSLVNHKVYSSGAVSL